ncbi:Hypothetical protein, putative [Bodo saltans]|uniref:HECT-type E3 ubiquitin transferase n=1 Tax=Bodo saltans TaxID=75058 RepID=A0A0S4JUC1_BODSA|nr:Hypothetical protein, putative [Bodo saltans]|eukprot:CUG93620.1 Hypothetical protein, putative [Bodo saltans]
MQPLTHVPTPKVLFDVILRITAINTSDAGFSQDFFELCSFIIDSEELFRMMEAGHNAITFAMWLGHMERFAELYNFWLRSYEKNRIELHERNNNNNNITTIVAHQNNNKTSIPPAHHPPSSHDSVHSVGHEETTNDHHHHQKQDLLLSLSPLTPAPLPNLQPISASHEDEEDDDHQELLPPLDVLVVLDSIVVVQSLCDTLENLCIPSSFMLHPEPMVRYRAAAISSTSNLSFELHSAQLAEVRRMAVHGTQHETTGASFPSLITLIQQYEDITFAQHTNDDDEGNNNRSCATAETRAALVECIWWSRLRLRAMVLYGERFGAFAIQNLIDINPSFFTTELNALCVHAPKLIESPDELISGIVSDIVKLFEVEGFDSISLFPVPEVFIASWTHLRNLFQSFGDDAAAPRTTMMSFRHQGWLSQGLVRALQWCPASDSPRRHDAVAFAKYKLSLLKDASIDEPLSHVVIAISKRTSEFLDHGLVETFVALLHKIILSLLSPPPSTGNDAERGAKNHDAGFAPLSYYLRVLRFNSIAQAVKSIFTNSMSHSSISPVRCLAHRFFHHNTSDDTSQQQQQRDLLTDLVELYVRCPEHTSSVVLWLITWCMEHNPRDIAHRLIEFDILGKLQPVLQRYEIARLKAIQTDLKGCTPLVNISRNSLQLAIEELGSHEDAKVYVKTRHIDFVSKAFLAPSCARECDQRRFLEFALSCDDATRRQLVLSILDNFERSTNEVHVYVTHILNAILPPPQQTSWAWGNNTWGNSTAAPSPPLCCARVRLVAMMEELLAEQHASAAGIYFIVQLIRLMPTSQFVSTMFLPAMVRSVTALSDTCQLDDSLLSTCSDGVRGQHVTTLLNQLLCMKFSVSLFVSEADQFEALWRPLEKCLQRSAAEVGDDRYTESLLQAFQLVRTPTAVFDLNKDHSKAAAGSSAWMPHVEAFLVEWGRHTFFAGLEHMPSTQASLPATKAAHSIIEGLGGRSHGFSWRSQPSGGALGRQFIQQALSHPKLRESGVLWHVLNYAGKTLRETAGKIEELKKLRSEHQANLSTKKGNKRERNARHVTKGKATRTPAATDDNVDASPQQSSTPTDTIVALESHFVEILTSMAPFLRNNVICGDLIAFISVFRAPSLEIEPSLNLSFSVNDLDEEFKITILRAFEAQFLSNDAVRNTSIPVASIVHVMFDYIPDVATEIYRRQMDVMLPEILLILRNEPFEVAMTADHLLRVYSIALCYAYHGAWKDEAAAEAQQAAGSTKRRIRKNEAAMTLKDDTAMCTLFSAVARLVGEWRQKRNTNVIHSGEGDASFSVADIDGMEALQATVMNTMTIISSKFYASQDSQLWLEANHLAQMSANVSTAAIESLFRDRVSLQICHYRWTARKVFQRLKYIEGPAENHIKIRLHDLKFHNTELQQKISNSREEFAIDADVFFADMLRNELNLDVADEALKCFLRTDVKLITMPSTDSSLLRTFVVLVAPATNDDIVPQKEQDVLLHTLQTLWPEVCPNVYEATHHSALRVLTALPRSLWPANPAVSPFGDEAELARSFFPVAEELIDDSITFLEKILDLVPQAAVELSQFPLDREPRVWELSKRCQRAFEFCQLLSVFFDRFDKFFRSVQGVFVSTYLQRHDRINLVLTRLVHALRDHGRLFVGHDGMRHGTQTLFFLLRMWTCGPLQARDEAHRLILGYDGQPTFSSQGTESDESDDATNGDEGEDDENDEENEENDSGDDDEAPENDEPARICDDFTKPFLALIQDISQDIVNNASHIQPPASIAVQPHVSPYHFCAPPQTLMDVEESVARLANQIALEDYVAVFAQFLTEHDKLREAAFSNISVVSIGSNATRLRAVSCLLTALSSSPSTNLKAPLIFNACVTLAAPALTGLRRSFNTMHVTEVAADNTIRFQLLRLIVESLGTKVTPFRHNILSTVLHIVSQTPVDEPDPVDNAESLHKECAVETCSIPLLHPHPLEYVSVTEPGTDCYVCRNASSFYHYQCTTCHRFSCCTACKVQCSDPTSIVTPIVRGDSQLPVTRFFYALNHATDDELVEITRRVLLLLSHQLHVPVTLLSTLFKSLFSVSQTRESCFAHVMNTVVDELTSQASKLLARRQARLKHVQSAIQNDVKADDATLLRCLQQADFSYEESESDAGLFCLFPSVVDHLPIECRALCPDDVIANMEGVIHMMTSTVALTFTSLSPAVTHLKCRPLAYSVSPLNLDFIAITARCAATWDSSTIVQGGQTRQPLQTHRIAKSSHTSIIFNEVIGALVDTAQCLHAVPQRSASMQELSSIANQNRSLVSFYLAASENPSEALDAGILLILDVGHFDFTVRERLFRGRLDAVAKGNKMEEPHEIVISRDNLLGTSFLALVDLRQVLENNGEIVEVKVNFDNEDSVDEGGVIREWITLFFQEIMKDGSALRRVQGGRYEINPCFGQSADGTDEANMPFEMIGVALGLALSLGVSIQPHFTRALYRHMTGCQPTFADLELSDPELFKSLMAVKSMSSDDEFDHFCQAFTISNGDGNEVELLPEGASLQVKRTNKEKYVELVANFVMTKRVHKRTAALLTGVSKWFPLEWLTSFTPEELELVCCGIAEIDVEDWRSHATYDGFTTSSPQIKWFWEYVESLSMESRARLLQFARGSSNAPAAGFGSLQPPFTIAFIHQGDEHFPSSHTCYNQLEIPAYSSSEILRSKFNKALDIGIVGFGLA